MTEVEKHADHAHHFKGGCSLPHPLPANLLPLQPGSFGISPEDWVVTRVSILLGSSTELASQCVSIGWVKFIEAGSAVGATLIYAPPITPLPRPEIAIPPLANKDIGTLEGIVSGVVSAIVNRVLQHAANPSVVLDG